MRPNQLNRKLKIVLSTTPGALILKSRMEKTKQLFRQPFDSIADVGYAVSYNDPAHFSRAFKK